MRTDFTEAQLADPDTRESEKILRACVHCGFCTATCPTYVLLGDELDSPRGRIYLLKNMLEAGGAPAAETVKHIDRCLSCLACMTTCPSGVHYMHLVDHGRRHIEEHYRRPWAERLLRRLLGTVLTRPEVMRLALRGARLAKPVPALLPKRLRPLVTLAPSRIPAASEVDRPQVFPAIGERRMRIALLPGCAQQALAPEINEATIRLLTRHGCEVVMAAGSGCCGALVHHLGEETQALAFARANIDAWERARGAGGLATIVANASGCGTMLKDYGFLLRTDPAYAEKAARIADLARDVSEAVAGLAGCRVGGRVSLRLLVAARTADRPRAEGTARRRRVRGCRCAGGTSLLRLGRHLQSAAAGAGLGVARPQARQHRADRGRSHRCRQYRLHHPTRRRWPSAGPAYRRAARLGDRRAYAPRTVSTARNRRANSGISKDNASALAPIALGNSQSAEPSITRPPAAPRST